MVSQRGRKPLRPAAIAAVREALALRIDLNALFQGLDDVDLLVKMSGGCIRDLMHLVTQSFKQVDGSSRATHQAVIEAIQEMRATYSTAVFASRMPNRSRSQLRQPVGRI